MDLYFDGVLLSSRSRPVRSDRAPCPPRSTPSTSKTPRATSASPTPFFEHLSSKLPVSRLQRDLTDFDRAAQHRRADGPRGDRPAIAAQGAEQGDPHPEALARDLRTTGPWWPRASRLHPAPQGFPKPHEALKAPDADQRPHHPRVDRGIHRNARRRRISQGRSCAPLALDLHGRVPVGRNRHRKQRQDPKASCLYPGPDGTVTPCSNAPYSRKTGSCPVHY